MPCLSESMCPTLPQTTPHSLIPHHSPRGPKRSNQSPAWRMQNRLYQRYVKLKARGKTETKIIVAIARELSAFLWELQTKLNLPIPGPAPAHSVTTPTLKPQEGAKNRPSSDELVRGPLIPPPAGPFGRSEYLPSNSFHPVLASPVFRPPPSKCNPSQTINIQIPLYILNCKRSTEPLSHFCQSSGGYGIYATRLSIV